MKTSKVIRLKQKAKKGYTWLWWSPLLTIPTLYYFWPQDFAFEVICAGIRQHCNFYAVERLTILFAIPISALWHLLFFRKTFNKDSDLFVRWHVRQALFLAGVRTAIPLSAGLLWGDDGMRFSVLPLIGVWLFGTAWGQRQAMRGDCWLMRKRGLETELAVYIQVEDEGIVGTEDLLKMLGDKMTMNRQKAALELGKLETSSKEVVKALQKAAAHDPNTYVRDASYLALQSPVHQTLLARISSEAAFPVQPEVAQSLADPQSEYERALVLLDSGDRAKAVEKFATAFRQGNRDIRALALAQLESLNEVEVF